MMRPDDISRPIHQERPNRSAESTLSVAGRYLVKLREAKSMSESRGYWPIKTWMTERAERKANTMRQEAHGDWGELFIRFRPIISVAFERGVWLHDPTSSRVDFVNRVVMALVDEVERDLSNDCFASLLWTALEVAVQPHAADIQTLHSKLHFRAVVDSCAHQRAVQTIVLLAYLRGEHMATNGQGVPLLTDLEFGELERACQEIEGCLLAWGDGLDHRTGMALSNNALGKGSSGGVVLGWIQ
ncbi:hypothetical protein ASE11_18600 [Hydrogenophaga sp. Root209]|uniref:hypothetical protein n=1 Tax=Hydrogenophaga sp. Root209 TaxID=1736490 RepID=UPI0006FCE700|nr:hypothetical protein [Hydrogenophaga sp. Root209]KRB95805.1 hypothetical protein ASE11_18600 [Hydrogenophaga sp. Root209]